MAQSKEFLLKFSINLRIAGSKVIQGKKEF